MTPRNPLPPERPGITHVVEIGGKKIYIRTGEYPSGELGEIFITIDREGEELRVYDIVAIMISKRLQSGTPLIEIIDDLEYQCMRPDGVTSNPDIPVCRSVCDYMAKWLRLRYLPPTPKILNQLDDSPDDSGHGDESPN